MIRNFSHPNPWPAAVAAAALSGAVISINSCSSNGQQSALSAGTTTMASAPQVIQALIPTGQFGRRRMDKMTPRFITIHSTQNFAAGANALAHANALKNGALTSKHNSLGYLTWHFTVDQDSVYQHLPVEEQGQHADYNGPGNLSSIGIEMCENAGNSLEMTMDRTARLVASLMKTHNIPIANIVPHQHWPRIRPTDGRDIGRKNCPHFLMDNGAPGPKWRAFLDRIEKCRRS